MQNNDEKVVTFITQNIIWGKLQCNAVEMVKCEVYLASKQSYDPQGSVVPGIDNP